MSFTRGQTQILYQFLPGAVFEHDQFGFCRVTTVELNESPANQAALFAAVAEHLWQWPNDSSRPGFADPRNEAARRNYVIGRPTAVRFEPFPTILECRRCGRVHRLRHLTRLQNARPRHCPDCQGLLGQLRYVQAHNCGRLEELYFPRRCARHGYSHLLFDDTGRVRSARWRCGACGNAELARLRMTPCNCTYARQMAGNQYERGLKTLVVTDSALFLPHVVPFINFDQEQERRLYGDPEIASLLLARTWGILDEPVPEVTSQREVRRQQSTDTSESDAMTAQLVEALQGTDPNNPLIQQWRERQNQQATPPGDAAIDQVRQLLEGAAPISGAAPARAFVEHVAIRDTLRTTTVDEVQGWMQERNDVEGVDQLSEAVDFAQNHLGIHELQIIDNFPIALCALGFTRVTRDPNRSILSPFESDDPQGRTPLYVVEAETEGIYVQLDSVEVARWLVDNRWIGGPAPESSDTAWAWLYRHIPGLRQHRWEPEYAEPLAVAVRSLVHTVSHVLLRHVEWSGFSQNSVGEYLMPTALACILYANRYAETKIGGLTTLFEHRLGIWLRDSAQAGRDCVYDPFCSDEGGTCVGCLHREHNCPLFNHELSRSVLYGGATPPDERGGGFGIESVRRGFWDSVPPATA